MTDVQCPVCEWSLSFEPEGDYEPGLLGVLGVMPTSLSMRDAEKVEQEVFDHISTHTPYEWVKAMAMADAYIEKIEAGLRDAALLVEERNQTIAQLRTMPALPAYPQAPMPDGAMPPPIMPPEWTGQYASPRDRQNQRAALRKQGLLRPPSDTLVPVIPTGQRAEGVVGRKFG